MRTPHAATWPRVAGSGDAGRVAGRPLDGATVRRSRAHLVARDTLSGRPLARRLAQQVDSWFDTLAGDLPAGWSLVATGGYARGLLCPGSDIDVVLLHPPRAAADQVTAVAESLWYPLWDGGVKLSPAVHSPKSLLSLAADDLVSATSILRPRWLAGDRAQVDALQAAGLEQWRKRPMQWLTKLRAASEERWARLGEVASRLEPDLKDGRGGQRDHDVLRWALATGRADVASALEMPVEDLAGAAETLLAVRCELHRVTGKALERPPAAGPGRGRRADGVRRRGRADGHGRRGGEPARLVGRAVLVAGRADRPPGQSCRRRAAATARRDPRRRRRRRRGRADPRRRARRAVARVPDRRGRRARRLRDQPADAARRCPRCATEDSRSSGPTARRQAFVSLLGSGEQVVPTVEALEQYDLFSPLLPEWRHGAQPPAAQRVPHVHRRPPPAADGRQRERARARRRPSGPAARRSARSTTSARASPATTPTSGSSCSTRSAVGWASATRGRRRDPVARPMAPAAVGDRDAARPRRSAHDLRTSPRRSVSVDGARAAARAHRGGQPRDGPVGVVGVEGGAGRPLVDAVARSSRGGPDLSWRWSRRSTRFPDLVDAGPLRRGAPHGRPSRSATSTSGRVATTDQPGVFAKVAGVAAIHGLDIVSAEASTTPDGVVVDQFQIYRPAEATPNWVRIDHDLRDVLDGHDRHRRPDRAADPDLRAGPPPRRRRDAAEPRGADQQRRIGLDHDDRRPCSGRARRPVPPRRRRSPRRALDIRSAKVATLGHEVVDVFYVQTGTDAGGSQVAPERHR